MGNFSGIIQGILIDKILKGDAPFLPKIKIGLGLAAVSGFFILSGLSVIIWAFHIWLKAFFALEIAYALTGLILMIVGIMMAAALYVMVQRQKNRLKNFRKEIEETVESIFDLLDEELKEPISENPKTAVLLSSLGGYLAGRKLF